MSGTFEERFNIQVNVEEVRRRFVNRVENEVFLQFLYSIQTNSNREVIERFVISGIGEKQEIATRIEHCTKGDFLTTLKALELFYEATPTYIQDRLVDTIEGILLLSETDIGIRWEEDHFVYSGAKLLDEKLVNDSLNWLRSDKKYVSVVSPFEKGLGHLLEAVSKPDRLSDVMTDMYEALEALAKIVTGRDAGLPAIKEQFIKAVKVSDQYKRILSEYVEYAQIFRHAPSPGNKKPKPSLNETESFVYMTGVFIRLAMPG